MKILLVYPKANERVIFKDKFSMHEPLALEYIAASIIDDHEVKILDTRIEDNLLETLEDFNPQIIATTGYTIHVNNCKQILITAKKFNKNILTVIGGHHATIKLNDFIEDYIDVVVIGEGVFTFQEIVRQWERSKFIKDIDGIAIVKDGKIIKTPHRAYTELDKLPFPARSLTRRYRHKYFIPTMKPLASIRTSVGCFFRCNYCALWQITQGKYLSRDPELIVKELAAIEEENIFFADDESMLMTERMFRLADQIKAAGLKKKYRLFARSDTIVRKPQLIEKWCEVGLHSMVIGFEAFTDEDLKKINKATTISINEEAISILKQNGVEICANFIITQDYDYGKFKRLSDYVKSFNLKIVVFPILTPLPGTKLYEETKDKITTDDYDIYDFKHTILPTKIPLNEFYDEFTKLHFLMFPLYRRFFYKYFFPLTRYLPTFKDGYEVLAGLKKLYKDHRLE